MPRRFRLPGRLRGAACMAAALLAGCGGGGDPWVAAPPAGTAACSVPSQQAWLDRHVDDSYFWYRLAPRPDPAGFADLRGFFDARLYTGSDAAFPRDRWSSYESTESFNRFFGDGQTLGYGVSVAGLEVRGQPGQPLFVRYVEPQSPAARAGVERGDQVLALNGRSAAEIVAADDFSALTAEREGQTLVLQLRRSGRADRGVTLTSAVFALTPVQGASIVTTAGGRRLGYVFVKDMVTQVAAPLDAAFAQFRAAGITEVVLDLRYNGGGLVSVGATVASQVAGARAAGQTFAALLYNDRQGASNERFAFQPLANALGASRVYVLAGPRTCSASEQVINGLRGVGVDVVAIGDTTCGKPVGSLPRSNCGNTFSVVNFESVNARNEGRYFDGFAPTCAVAEDFGQPLGAAAEPLLAAAARFADRGSCPPAAGDGPTQRIQSAGRGPRPGAEPGERQQLIGR